MSDEQTETAPNPAKLFCEWSSKEKTFRYWDKTKEANVPIRQFELLVLYHLNKVGGFNKRDNCGFNSTEVSDFNHDLQVSCWKGSFNASGSWPEIKEKVRAAGGRFAKSIYGMTIRRDAEGLAHLGQLVNITLVGSGMTVWIDLNIKHDTFKEGGSTLKWDGNAVTKHGKDTKGNPYSYNVPNLMLKDIDEGIYEEAEPMRDLMMSYFRERGIEMEDEYVQADAKVSLQPAGPTPEEDDEVPF
jgi:hypothetical protein